MTVLYLSLLSSFAFATPSASIYRKGGKSVSEIMKYRDCHALKPTLSAEEEEKFALLFYHVHDIVLNEKAIPIDLSLSLYRRKQEVVLQWSEFKSCQLLALQRLQPSHAKEILKIMESPWKIGGIQREEYSRPRADRSWSSLHTQKLVSLHAHDIWSRFGKITIYDQASVKQGEFYPSYFESKLILNPGTYLFCYQVFLSKRCDIYDVGAQTDQELSIKKKTWFSDRGFYLTTIDVADDLIDIHIVPD